MPLLAERKTPASPETRPAHRVARERQNTVLQQDWVPGTFFLKSRMVLRPPLFPKTCVSPSALLLFVSYLLLHSLEENFNVTNTLSFSKRNGAKKTAASLYIYSPIILLLYHNFQIMSNAAGLSQTIPFHADEIRDSLSGLPQKFFSSIC